MASPRHNFSKIFVIMLTTGINILMLVLYVMSATGTGKHSGIFLNTQKDLQRKYKVCINQIHLDWINYFWSVIYIWSLVWIIYGLSSICRRTETTEGSSYLYLYPNVLPQKMWTIYGVALGLNIGAIFLWDREYLLATLFLFILCIVGLYCCLGLSYKAAHNNRRVLHEMRKDKWFIRVIIQNGLALYTGWVTIETFITFDVVLRYKAGITSGNSSLVTLILLGSTVLVYFFVEVCFVRHVRYTWTHYPAIIFGLFLILFNNNSTLDTTSIKLCTAITAITFLLFIIKICICLTRTHREYDRLLYS